jgi:hypothetical protein
MPRNAATGVKTKDDRRGLAVPAAVTAACFVLGLGASLHGMGLDIAPSGGRVQEGTVDGVITSVHVDRGGHAVACSSTYSSSNCSTVGIVVPAHPAKK